MKIIFLLIFDAAVQAAHQITAQTQLDKFLRSVSSFCIIILYKGSKVLKNPEIFSPLSCKKYTNWRYWDLGIEKTFGRLVVRKGRTVFEGIVCEINLDETSWKALEIW